MRFGAVGLRCSSSRCQLQSYASSWPIVFESLVLSDSLLIFPRRKSRTSWLTTHRGLLELLHLAAISSLRRPNIHSVTLALATGSCTSILTGEPVLDYAFWLKREKTPHL